VLAAQVDVTSSVERLEGSEPTSEDCALESPEYVPGSVEITSALDCNEETVKDGQSQSAEEMQPDIAHVARNDGTLVKSVSRIRHLARKKFLPVESEFQII
jgi:hypothetical protein